MKQSAILILLAFTVNTTTRAQKFKPLFCIMFDTAYGKALLWQCSREIPRDISGFWIISKKEANLIETHFEALYSVTTTGCCLGAAKVDSLKKFGFQYLGVIVSNQKFVYINAFPIQILKDFKEQNYDLAKIPVTVCDGGASFWGVLFDPETKQFSSLNFNGQ